MDKYKKLKKLEEELKAQEQYMDLCGYGVKDTLYKMYLEDEIYNLTYEIQEDLDEESEESTSNEGGSNEG